MSTPAAQEFTCETCGRTCRLEWAAHPFAAAVIADWCKELKEEGRSCCLAHAEHFRTVYELRHADTPRHRTVQAYVMDWPPR